MHSTVPLCQGPASPQGHACHCACFPVPLSPVSQLADSLGCVRGPQRSPPSHCCFGRGNLPELSFSSQVSTSQGPTSLLSLSTPPAQSQVGKERFHSKYYIRAQYQSKHFITQQSN